MDTKKIDFEDKLDDLQNYIHDAEFYKDATLASIRDLIYFASQLGLNPVEHTDQLETLFFNDKAIHDAFQSIKLTQSQLVKFFEEKSNG